MNVRYEDDATPGAAVYLAVTGQRPEHGKALAQAVQGWENFATHFGLDDTNLIGYEAIGKGLLESRPGLADLELRSITFFARAYEKAFGHLAYSDQLQHFLGQETYLSDLYEANGFTPFEAAVAARGAALGQLIGHAVQDVHSPLYAALS